MTSDTIFSWQTVWIPRVDSLSIVHQVHTLTAPLTTIVVTTTSYQIRVQREKRVLLAVHPLTIANRVSSVNPVTLVITEAKAFALRFTP